MGDFEKELEKLINRYSKENDSDTPDYILAKYLLNCLINFNTIVNERDEWHGFKNPHLNNMEISGYEPNSII